MFPIQLRSALNTGLRPRKKRMVFQKIVFKTQ